MAKALVRLRARANQGDGMTQEEAAAAMNWKRQSWSRYEKGEVQDILRTDQQDRLAEALGFTRQDLMDEFDNIVRPEFPRAVSAPPPGRRPDIRDTAVYLRVRPQLNDAGRISYGVAETPAAHDLGWLFSDSAGFLRLAGELPGFAEEGVVVGYDRNTWPSKGDGCVIELKSGDLRPGVYERQTPAGVVFREGGDTSETVPLGDIVGVYAIRYRAD